MAVLLDSLNCTSVYFILHLYKTTSYQVFQLFSTSMPNPRWLSISPSIQNCESKTTGTFDVENVHSTHPSPSLAWWNWSQPYSDIIPSNKLQSYPINQKVPWKVHAGCLTWQNLAFALLLLVHIHIWKLPHLVHCIRLDSSERNSTPLYKTKLSIR